MLGVRDKFRRPVASWAVLLMFCFSLAFLIVVAIMLVLWVNVPFFISPYEDDLAQQSVAGPARPVVAWISHRTANDAGYHCLLILLLIYGEFLIRCSGSGTLDRRATFWRRI